MKYRKNPIVIEAFKWTADVTKDENPEWLMDAIKSGLVWFNNGGTKQVTMIIATLEGNHTANRGDYIIKGIKGEIYPCKPDIFEVSYSIDV